MTSSLSTRILAAVALIVIIAAAYYFTRSGDYEEARVYGPQNRQLLIERMHIAERWLVRENQPLEVLNTLQFLESLPANARTLIIPTALGELSRIEAAQLQQWILRGGHLIAIAPNNLSGRDSAFDLNPFGVHNCYECLRDAIEDELKLSKDQESPSAEVMNRVEISGIGPRTLKLWSQVALAIEEPSSKLKQWRSDLDVPMLVRYDFGAGQITLLPDNEWLENEQMIEADHVRLLSALIPEQTETVYLQHYNIPGGLLTWLWQQAPLFWIALLTLLALWIWSRLPRLGAILADPEPRANQMRDRLRATARFDWRHNQGKQLLSAMREVLSQSAQRRYPDWHQLSHSEQSDRLSRLCPDLQAGLIEQFLTQDVIAPADRLIDFLSLQRQLMRAL